MAKLNLDEMIMEVEVKRIEAEPEDRIKLKFLAIAGGNGPGVDMPESLARTVYEKLGQALQIKS